LAGQECADGTGRFLVILSQPLAGQAQEALRCPKVNFVLGKDDPLAALLVRYLIAFDALRDASSTFLIGKKSKVEFSGWGYDTRKSVPTDIGAG